MRAYCIPGKLLLILLALLLMTGHIFAQAEEEDSLWQETQQAVQSSNQKESLRLLRLCVLGGVRLPDSEKQLREVLLSEISLISKGRSIEDLTVDELERFHVLQNEICALSVAEAGDWLLLMKAGMAIPGSQKLVISGEKFLKAVERGLPVAINHDWRNILQKLDQIMVRDEQVLYRLQIAQIFAGYDPGSADAQQHLADIKLLAEARAVKILQFAEIEIALGNLAKAREHLDQVRNFDPAYSGLTELYQRLEKAEKIDEIIVKANEALLERDYESVKRHVRAVFELDPNNFFARQIVVRLEEESQRKGAKAASKVDLLQLKIRRLEAQLRHAEADDNLLDIRRLLKEILLYKHDSEYILQLEKVDEEIAVSRLKADERFVEAEKLFRRGDYENLWRFINRNPGLINSLEKMQLVWEMRLMANYATGRLDVAALREAADEITRQAGRSFYASYVCMRLSIAENKLDDARVHYNIAAEIRPKDPLLRWPGLLLWAHGDGRPVAVIVLIIALFFLIKMIVPFFAWFESTYWWRISLLSGIFPSLAIRSLESCFGTVKERAERITLFTLLMKSCYRVGKYDKALLYAENLLEIVPGSAAALEMRSKVKGRKEKAAKKPEYEDVSKNQAAQPVVEPEVRNQAVLDSGEPAVAEEPESTPAAVSDSPIEQEFVQPVEDVDDVTSEQPIEPEFGHPVASGSDAGSESTEKLVVEPSAPAQVIKSGLTKHWQEQETETETETETESESDSEPEPAPEPETPTTKESEDSSMVWYEDEEDKKSKNEGVAEVMADLFNDFFSENQPAPDGESAYDKNLVARRRELFGELDAIQAEESLSKEWLQGDATSRRERLFSDLDRRT